MSPQEAAVAAGAEARRLERIQGDLRSVASEAGCIAWDRGRNSLGHQSVAGVAIGSCLGNAMAKHASDAPHGHQVVRCDSVFHLTRK